MNNNKRIFGFDLMRAIAILFVVLSHCIWFFPNVDGLVLTLFNFSGYLGVEIFFVLSGFLIGNILYRLFVHEKFDSKRLLNFWKRRWFRTLPNYYLVLVINTVLAYFLYHDLSSDIWKYVFFLQNFTAEQSPFFYESWSLSIEEFAYIIGPSLLYVSMMTPIKIDKSKVFLSVTLLIISFFIFTKLAFHYSHDHLSSLEWTTQLKSVVIYRIDAIYYGFLAAYLYNCYKRLWAKRKNGLIVFGILLFVSFNLTLSMNDSSVTLHPFIWNVVYMPLISISIVCTLPFFSTLHWNNSMSNIITKISVLSYSIYLLHYSIILKLFKYFTPEQFTGLKLYALIGLYLFVLFISSSLLYRYFEKPFMDLRNNSKLR